MSGIMLSLCHAVVLQKRDGIARHGPFDVICTPQNRIGSGAVLPSEVLGFDPVAVQQYVSDYHNAENQRSALM